jgi:hypothetical protein
MKFTEILKSISRSERRFIIGAVVVVLILSSLPYIYGWWQNSNESLYLGNYHRASGDYYVYMSMVEEAKTGAITFHNLFTSEDHPPVLINPFWFCVGQTARIFNIDTRLAIHIFRMALIPLTILAIYLTIATFLRKKPFRYLTFALAFLGSGFGYLYFLFSKPEVLNNLLFLHSYESPTDIWVTEGYSLLIFLASPHFQASLICLFLAIIFFYLGFRYGNFRYLVISGLFNLALAFFHPYETVYLLLITGLYTFLIIVILFHKKKYHLSRKFFYRFLIPNLIAAPGLLYQIYIFRLEPVLRSWSEQSQTISPNFKYYLLGWGILLPLALVGSVFLVRKINYRRLWLLVWCWGTIPILYFPIAFNRRFIEGVFVPLGILAALGIYFLFTKFKTKTGRIIYSLALGIILAVSLLPTNIYNLWSFTRMQEIYKSTPFYLPQEEYQALEWLKNNSTPSDVILSEHISGFIIPAFTARRVYIGHDLQTANFTEKKNRVEWFFKTPDNDTEKLAWLKDNNISFLFYGPNEQSSSVFSPTEKAYLEEVFTNSQVLIFKVSDSN